MVRMTVEICVEGARDARAAMAGGADRIELCAEGSLAVEGLTPDDAAIARACAGAAVPVHVLIRPRAGDFLYSATEFEAMRRSIEAARAGGAAGVVVGLLGPDGAIDAERTAALVAQARPLSLTFHKAFDALADPLAGLDVLARIGVDRVLTSGAAPGVREGLATLAALVRRAGGDAQRPRILAGGRVRAEDIPRLLDAGVREVHAASAVMVDGRVDPEAVARFVAAVRRAEADLPQDRTSA